MTKAALLPWTAERPRQVTKRLFCSPLSDELSLTANPSYSISFHHQLAVGSIGQLLEEFGFDGFTQEMHGAIAEGEVRPARVPTAEATDIQFVSLWSLFLYRHATISPGGLGIDECPCVA